MLSPIELERTLETLRNNCYPNDWKNIVEKINGINLDNKFEQLSQLITDIKQDIDNTPSSRRKSEKYKLIELIQNEFEIETNVTVTY